MSAESIEHHLRRVRASHDYDLRRTPFAATASQDFQPADLGQSNVQQHDAEIVTADLLHCLCTIARDFNRKTFISEKLPQPSSCCVIVINNQQV
ncbi:MAG TPA: hypothetical protein VKA59_13690 [Vicinamibacterales bacterium]|nr:hypothetical protein [Vicinamibacterales bacterium]